MDYNLNKNQENNNIKNKLSGNEKNNSSELIKKEIKIENSSWNNSYNENFINNNFYFEIDDNIKKDLPNFVIKMINSIDIDKVEIKKLFYLHENLFYNNNNNLKEICNCSKTKCSNSYCICFRKKKNCNKNCECFNCHNVDSRNLSINNIFLKFKENNENTKIDQFFKGCNCLKSKCNNNYCDCLVLGLNCSNICNCLECCNNKIQKYHSTQKIISNFKKKINHLKRILIMTKDYKI